MYAASRSSPDRTSPDRNRRWAGPEQILIPAGRFTMGSDHHYEEEGPAREASAGAFLMDVHPVTNREFAEFAADAGYVTGAETTPPPDLFPEAEAGSLVFFMTPGPVNLGDYRNWWTWTPGADWRHPAGPGSDLDGLWDHPVTHVSHADAAAYAQWAGKSLPTETEWEYAARGGLEGAEFAWGDRDHQQTDRPAANTWQGRFPYENTDPHGWARTSPVGWYPPNGYGLYDLIGNVWEWTADDYAAPRSSGMCCAPGGEPGAAGETAPMKVIKGGSHLCAIQYCFRYRPAARQPQTADTSSGHIGFRCVTRLPEG